MTDRARPGDESRAPAPARVATRSLVALFLRLGISGFGGPLVHIAMMEREVVERRGWLTRTQFLDALAICQMLPGPASTQLGVLVCHLKGGLRGALAGGAAFVLPGFAVMLALTLAHARWGAVPAVGAALLGIAPVVVVIIGFAAARLARTACAGPGLAALAAAGFLLTALTRLETVIVIVLGGVAWSLRRRAGLAAARAWAAPLVLTADPELYARLAWLWIKMGALVYGGGYVIVPVVRTEVVERLRWMTDAAFLDGLALSQVTPGPIVNLSVFVGYQAGGLAGAVLAAASVFAPAFAIVLLAARFMPRLTEGPAMRAFLLGVNATVVGAIAGAAVPLARSAFTSPFAIAIGLAAAVILWRTRVDTAWLVLGAGALGAAFGAVR